MATLAVRLSYPVFRAIEAGKITPKQFRKRALRMSRRLDRLERQTLRQVRDALGDVDRTVRDRIIQATDADTLGRSNINQVIDDAVDQFKSQRRGIMQRGNQSAVDEAQKFRQDLSRSVGQPAPQADVQRGLARDLSTMQSEANDAFANDLRRKLKREVAQGLLDGKTPRQVAGEMVKKRIATPRKIPQTKAQKRERGRAGLPDTMGKGALAQAESLTRNEIRSTFNSANFSGARAEQKTKAGILKAWVDQDDARVRATHVQAGRIYAVGSSTKDARGRSGPIPVHEAFIVGGTLLRFPSDPAGVAKETRG